MRTTSNIDGDLLANATKLAGNMDRTAIVSEGLKAFIEHHAVHDKGIGYVDVHLLASVALTEAATLWTGDKRLHDAARALGCAFRDTGAH